MRFQRILERFRLRRVRNADEYDHRKLFQRAYRPARKRMPLHGERLVQYGHDAIRPSEFSDGAELRGGICVRLYGRDLHANPADDMPVRPVLERFVLCHIHHANLLSFGAVCKWRVRIHFFGNGVSVRPVLERLGVRLVHPIKYRVNKYGDVRRYERATGMYQRRRHMGQFCQLLQNADDKLVRNNVHAPI